MHSYFFEFYLAGLGTILLLLDAFLPTKKALIGLFGTVGMALLALLLFALPYETLPQMMRAVYQETRLITFYKLIAVVSTFLVFLMTLDFQSILKKYTSPDGKDSSMAHFYCLLPFVCSGLCLMASAIHFTTLFLGLEIVTISFYILVAGMRRNVGSLEAGVKYLVLGGLSTAFLVYGIAWVYGACGSLSLSTITSFFANNPVLHPHTLSWLLVGLGFLTLAFGFKIGVVPFQLWIPDVYQGAPTPITAFLSVGSKAAGFFAMMLVFEPFLHYAPTASILIKVCFTLAALTLLYGNLAAIPQKNFKRLLAYSSIAHAGFLLLGVASLNFASVRFYLAVYLVMTFSAFFIAACLRSQDGNDSIAAFDGLGKRNPLLALLTTITLAAMAGLPLTGGFWAKFFIFSAAIQAQVSWWIIGIAFIGVTAGFYYYFKVIAAMYWNIPANNEPIKVPPLSLVVITFLTLAILVLGFFPPEILLQFLSV